MRPSHLILLPVAALLIAACSSGGGATGGPSAPSSGAPLAPSTRIEVTLTDQLRIEPAPLTVPAGVPITFVVSNTGAIPHEFYIGDEEAQAAHEQEMQAGGMAHDDPAGISVAAGETRELMYTFDEPGETLVGCHEPGHYAGGMKATITVGG